MCDLDDVLDEVKRLSEGLEEFKKKAEKSILLTAAETKEAVDNSRDAKTSAQLAALTIKNIAEKIESAVNTQESHGTRISGIEITIAKAQGAKMGAIATVTLFWALLLTGVGAAWKFFTQGG